jgi:hypothetical protein
MLVTLSIALRSHTAVRASCSLTRVYHYIVF